MIHNQITRMAASGGFFTVGMMERKASADWFDDLYHRSGGLCTDAARADCRKHGTLLNNTGECCIGIVDFAYGAELEANRDAR